MAGKCAISQPRSRHPKRSAGMSYESQLIDILEESRSLFTDILPSDWAEKKRVLSSEVSPYPGPFSFSKAPYLIDVVNCLSPDNPARIIAVMKGAQIWFSTSVIENGIGWIIDQSPGNTLFMTGSPDLTEEAVNKKIDQMIDSAGLRPLIKPNSTKTRNQRTGDTKKSKEFPGGSLFAGSASNHKLLRQLSAKYGFIDDFDSIKKSSNQSGNTRSLLEKRFTAYYDKMKLYYISTPELKVTSNIEPAFLKGDQRYYHIPCPCCGEYIILKWNAEMANGDRAGIVWELDSNGLLIPGTVGYKCQQCGDFFNDSIKHDLLQKGEWRATAAPSEPGYVSFHISGLYGPRGNYDWEYYVREYLEACPPGQSRKEDLYKVFVNTVLGETYEQQDATPEAKTIQRNIRNYEIGSVPEKISVRDGNGEIIMLTCACDLNGTEDDARLDYEVVAWAETGSSYSIEHGSIGTFVPREGIKKNKADRQHWTYQHNVPFSVWDELERLVTKIYETDNGKRMQIVVTGIDTGHYTNHAYAFIDKPRDQRITIVGVRGDKEAKAREKGRDMPVFKPALERKKLFMLDVNHIKDQLFANINLQWAPGGGDQPQNFLNFPVPAGGKYLFDNFFAHFEAEYRQPMEKNDGSVVYRWVKKPGQPPNHHWDIYVYNMALKQIWAALVLKEAGVKDGSWPEFVQIIKKIRNNG